MRIAVTGAFGYSGRYITRRLLQHGHDVFTLTQSPNRKHPFGTKVVAHPFHFHEPELLLRSLLGTDVLINTYWVRFDHALFTHEEAVANTKVLFHAARQAWVKRIIHISITHPDLESPLPYFRGKAELESTLRNLDIPHCIFRPTVLFGIEDVLINNIAWAARHLPILGVFGAGDYKLQPIYVDDLAAAVVEKIEGQENETIEAIGPETFTYRGLVKAVVRALGLKRCVVGLPPGMAYWACRALGRIVNDVVITREEIQGLMEGRLCVDAPPLGGTRLTDWMRHNRDTLGRRYMSEMGRRTDRRSAYQAVYNSSGLFKLNAPGRAA
jgi:NADH dehydrogenase